MSSAQSTLAAPDVSQHEAAAVGQAVEDTLLGSGSSSQPRSTQSGTDPIASSSGHVAEEVDDEEDNDGAVDVDGEEDEPSATTGSAGAAAAKKRKKKSKNKGKGKATFDKVKDAFTGKSSSSSSSGGSNNVNSKSNAGQGPPSGILKTSRSGGNNKAELSDELYERIVQQAKLNVGEAEAAKLDRASVAKMVEGEAGSLLTLHRYTGDTREAGDSVALTECPIRYASSQPQRRACRQIQWNRLYRTEQEVSRAVTSQDLRPIYRETHEAIACPIQRHGRLQGKCYPRA